MGGATCEGNCGHCAVSARHVHFSRVTLHVVYFMVFQYYFRYALSLKVGHVVRMSVSGY